jgi:soluble lytic murein transglycosylase-like protein
MMMRLFALLCGFLFVVGSAGAQVPAAATPYRADLTRQARLVWGLNAPVAAFAAQIHQESGWRPDAVSRVGARGMAQFMPATARWWCELHRMSAADCQPTNPTWAMRALVGYDRWLWERIALGDDGDRMWAALRAYNGGLGHWRAEARNAVDKSRAGIDAACGSARRHVSHCRENLGYPRRILVELQPRYAAWGPRVEVAQ